MPPAILDSDGDGNISGTELSDNVQSLFDNLRGQLMGGPPPRGPPPRDNDGGSALVTLLDRFVSQDADSSASGTMLNAAA